MPGHTMRLFPVIAAFLSAVCAQTPVPTQNAEGKAAESATLTLPAGISDLRALVRTTAAFVGVDIAVDDDDLPSATTVRLTRPLQLNRDQAVDALSNLLFARGVVLGAADPTTHACRVVALGGERAAAALATATTTTTTEILAHPTRRQAASTTVKLDHKTAESVRNGLRPFLSHTGKASDALLSLTALDERTVQLTGLQSEVARTIMMLREIDAAPSAESTDPPTESVEERIQHLVDALQGRAAALDQAVAQVATAGAAPTPIRADATTMIVTAGSHGLGDLIHATASFLRLNILAEGLDLDSAPPVRLAQARALDCDQAMEFTSEQLATRGFLLAPLDEALGLFRVVAMDARGRRDAMVMATWRSPEQALARPTLRQPVAVAMRMRSVSLTATMGAMRPFYLERDVMVTFAGCDAENLILVGDQREVALIVGFLRALEDGRPRPIGVLVSPTAAAGGKRIGELMRRIAGLERQLAAGAPAAASTR